MKCVETVVLYCIDLFVYNLLQIWGYQFTSLLFLKKRSKETNCSPLKYHSLCFLSAIVCPWLDFGFPPRCPRVVWCHWAIFCHAGSGRVGRVRSAREKSLEILCRGWELNPGHGEDRQWAIPLSYHDWLAYFTGIKISSVSLASCIWSWWPGLAVPHWRSGFMQYFIELLMSISAWATTLRLWEVAKGS